MNKAAALRSATESKWSVGDLRKLIQSQRPYGGASVVNPALSRQQALDLYEAALAERDDAEVPEALFRGGPSRWALTVANILRDCHP
jgi:hypothetical protein